MSTQDFDRMNQETAGTEFESRQDSGCKRPRLETQVEESDNEAKIRILEAKLAQRDLEAKLAQGEAKQAKAKLAQRDLEAKIKLADAILQSHSIGELLKKMPTMAVNPDCNPSIVSNDKAQEDYTEYRSRLRSWWTTMKKLKASQDGDRDAQIKEHLKQWPSKPSFHEPAKISKVDYSRYMDFELKVNDENGMPITSKIMGELLRLERQGKRCFPNYNETSPRALLFDAIKDILFAYRVPGDVLMETSLFSVRPDLVVVMYEGRIIFMVEVKNPSTSNLPVFTSEVANGQGHDYNLTQRQVGTDQPFVLLSTFNETAILRLGTDDDKYQEHLSKALGLLKQQKIENVMRSGNADGDNHKPPISPEKEHLEFKLDRLVDTVPGSGMDVDVEDEDDSDEDCMDIDNDSYNYRGRHVTASEVFDVKRLYKVIALVCASSIIAVDASKESIKPLVPREGQTFHGRELCTLFKDGFSHLKTKQFQASYSEPPSFPDAQRFHVYCSLGQGSVGRCILCSSTTGKMFVAKLFFLRVSIRYSSEDRETEFQRELEEKTKLAENEKKRWLDLAPRKCRRYCHVKTLNGTPALTMPFFLPIPTGRREEYLEPIRTCLEKIAQQRNDLGTDRGKDTTIDKKLSDDEHYLYREIQWRHFGCRYVEGTQNLEITPLDLGSLEKVKCENYKQRIDEQIKMLRERMRTEEIPDPRPPYASQN